MAYDTELTTRYRTLLHGTPRLSEKKMMGGVCFFAYGNMIGGADRTRFGEGRFLFRIGKQNQPPEGGKPMMQGGRRMGGFYFVDADVQSDTELRNWISMAVRHALSLPPK